MKKIVSGVFFVFVFLILPNFASADTIISSNITTNTIWSKDASPYLINGNIEVEVDTTLTIDPGVVVKFGQDVNGSDYYMWVRGNLVANGLPEDKINFTTANNDLIGGWLILIQTPNNVSISNATFNHFYYLGFDGPANVSLSNIDVSNASGGVSFSNVGSATIENSHFSNLRYGGIMSDSGNLSIHNSIIENLQYATAVQSNGNLEVIDSKIKGVSDGTALSANRGNVNIQNSIFENGTGGSGLSFSKANVTIASSSVSNFEYEGINVSGGSFSGDKITLSDNLGGGILLEDEGGGPSPMFAMMTVIGGDPPPGSTLVSASISQSRIVNNSTFGLQNDSSIIIDAKNNWWGDPTGPKNVAINPVGLGNEIIGNVGFAPWLENDPWEVQVCCSNVLFIPGFMASDLYVQGSIFENKLWVPDSLLKTDIEKLMLDSSGNPITPGIYTKGIISEASGFNIYKSFIQKMNDMVTQRNLTEWEPFPYDWRKDIDKVVNESTIVKIGNNFENKKLIDEATALAQRSPTGKITIIGHSNGGLVGKALIKELQNQGKASIIDQFIMIATPQIGTPKAIAGLLHGDQQALLFGLLLDKDMARKLGYNMQSAYNLLPSRSYFSLVSDPVIKFNDSINQVFNYSANGFLQSVSGYDGMFNFLTLNNRGTTLGDPTNVPSILRSDLANKANSNVEALTNWQIPSNIKVFEIAGWGEQTIKGVDYKSKQENTCSTQGGLYICQPQSLWDRKLLMTEDGDGTVVIPSATDYNTPNEYYLNLFDLNNVRIFNLKHHNILEASQLLETLSKILTNSLGTLPDFISTQKPISTNQNLQLSVHSPVSLGVYSNSLYTGPSSTTPTDAFTFIREEIPNSYYLEIGEDKYIGLPKGGSYAINLQGEGTGTFTFNQEITQGGQTIDSKSFIDIPVTPLTKASLSIDNGILSPSLNLDVDGNGSVDIQVQTSNEFDPVAYLTVMKSIVKSFNLKKAQENNLINKIDNLIKLIQKGKIQKASSKAEIYVKKLNSKFEKLNNDHKKRKNNKITEEEIQNVIQNLEEFINNLK
jgi:hypothetical protein